MRVEANTDGKRIYARSMPFSEEAVRILSSVPGARYRAARKEWSFGLDMDTCRQLRKALGKDLLVMKPLADWARGEVAHESAIQGILSGDIAPELSRVASLSPKLYSAIQDRSYQPVGAGFLLEAQHAILGDQPGLGKTLQGLAVLLQSGAKRILVVCPRTACRNVWESETARWAPTISTYVAQGDRANRQKVINRFLFCSKRAGQHMLIVNTEMMRMIPEVCPDGPIKNCKKETLKGARPPAFIPGVGEVEEEHKHEFKVAEWPVLSSTPWDAIILDESHNSLASTSNVQSKNITQVRFGAMHIRYMLDPDGIAIAMSGTPFRSRLQKSWGTLNWLEPGKFSSFWKFAERHFGVTEGEYGNSVAPEPIDLDDFLSTLAPYYLVRTKADVATDLPPIFYAGEPPASRPEGLPCTFLDMDPQQARAYDEMRARAIATIREGSISAVGLLAELTRLRQLACSYGRFRQDKKMVYNDYMGENVEQVTDSMSPSLPSNKIDWLIEFLLEREGNEGKVVVASSFSQLIGLAAEAVRKELKYPVLTLTGATSDAGRTELVRRFQDPRDPARVAIINSRAGGEAITLDLADDMVFLDLPWTSDEITQVEARIHRVSRIHNVTVYRLMSRGTIDERMASATDDQLRILKSARPEARHVALAMLEAEGE